MPNNIDPARLAAIFRTLTTRESLKQENQNKSNTIEQNQISPAMSLENDSGRDRDALRKKLKDKLNQLKQEGSDFEATAPIVAIREILLWEFGEDFINHPNFKNITSKVLVNISSNPELVLAFRKIVKDLL